MVRDKVVVAVRLPDVPVIVIVGEPGTAEALVVSVNVLEFVVGFGENDAVTPLGKPDTARFTLPVNPYCGFTSTYVVLEVPWPIVTAPLVSVKVGL